MEVSHVAGKTLAPNEWDYFVRQSPQGSIYSLHAYLCASYPSWEALILKSAGAWQAVFPLFPKKRYGVKLLWQPLFSQYTGILLRPLDHTAPLSYYQEQKNLIEALLAHLPTYQLFSIQFSPAFDYPLPFYWQGFELHSRYTYQVPLSPKPTFQNLRTNLQRNIRKAEKTGWSVAECRDVEPFARLMEQTWGTQIGLKEIADSVTNLAHTFLNNDLGKLWACKDQEGHLRAGILLGQDWKTTYYLMGAAEPEARKAGALSLLLWQGIQQAATHSKVFDFEGSMQRNLEHFFRGFGAKPVPYLRIYRNQLPLKRLWAIFGY